MWKFQLTNREYTHEFTNKKILQSDIQNLDVLKFLIFDFQFSNSNRYPVPVPKPYEVIHEKPYPVYVEKKIPVEVPVEVPKPFPVKGMFILVLQWCFLLIG